jgi:hypothetical protein
MHTLAKLEIAETSLAQFHHFWKAAAVCFRTPAVDRTYCLHDQRAGYQRQVVFQTIRVMQMLAAQLVPRSRGPANATATNCAKRIPCGAVGFDHLLSETPNLRCCPKPFKMHKWLGSRWADFMCLCLCSLQGALRLSAGLSRAGACEQLDSRTGGIVA